MSANSGDALTANLLQTIRIQRHLGTRIFISTQEPTVNPALIDLCSMTIVHRFSSPEWLNVLRRHVAALNKSGYNSREDDDPMKRDVFEEIVRLRVGEALLFAPEAITISHGDRHERSRSPTKDISHNLSTRSWYEKLLGNGGDNVGDMEKVVEADEEEEEDDGQKLRKLGTGYTKMKVRDRLTNDGGRSVLAA